MDRQRGQSLIELVVAVAILGMVVLVTDGAVESARRRVALAAAVSELRATVMYVRTLAVTRDRNVAMRFTQEGDGRWAWTVYEDGDRDGVRNDDIQKGVDRRIVARRGIQYAPARIGVPDAPVPDPMNGSTLQTRPPVRYGNSMLCSFSRQGEVTNGSLVLTDGRDAAIVRTYGTTGRVAVLRWDGKQWKTGA
jgi:prepilin-type N-terminal cleavage/methylation domain-containing protein